MADRPPKFKPGTSPTTARLGKVFIHDEPRQGEHGPWWSQRLHIDGQAFTMFLSQPQRDTFAQCNPQEGDVIRIYKDQNGHIRFEKPATTPQQSTRSPDTNDFWNMIDSDEVLFMLKVAKDRFLDEQAQQAHFATLFINWGKAGSPPLEDK